MYPTLDDGELLICSKLDPVYYSHTIKNDRVFVFVTQDEVLVKRATNKIYPNGIVTLHSDNSEAYKPFNMKVSKLKEVWKVEGVIKTSLPKPKDDSKTVEKLKEILSSMIDK
jgi:phage repressor protein C with HTH and peptisase S24 domain